MNKENNELFYKLRNYDLELVLTLLNERKIVQFLFFYLTKTVLCVVS